jgi:5-methylcytosine-specific restriction endonuclease McrA
MRNSLITPIPEIFVAAKTLQQAFDAHIEGRPDEAARFFAEADDPAIWAFTDQAWGKGCKDRFSFKTDPNAPKLLPLKDRPLPRMPSAACRKEVLARDGFHCRFCSMPVIDAKIRRLAHELYPESVRWGRSNTEQHAAFQCMWLQYDHILPNSRGGASSLENIVVACAPCNFSRMQTTLDEADLYHPLEEPRVAKWDGHTSWDGLEYYARKLKLRSMRPFLLATR